ncbi:hypothetical protein BB560_002841, partial [Smittium megazygosporum]
IEQQRRDGVDFEEEVYCKSVMQRIKNELNEQAKSSVDLFHQAYVMYQFEHHAKTEQPSFGQFERERQGIMKHMVRTLPAHTIRNLSGLVPTKADGVFDSKTTSYNKTSEFNSYHYQNIDKSRDVGDRRIDKQEIGSRDSYGCGNTVAGKKDTNKEQCRLGDTERATPDTRFTNNSNDTTSLYKGIGVMSKDQNIVTGQYSRWISSTDSYGYSKNQTQIMDGYVMSQNRNPHTNEYTHVRMEVYENTRSNESGWTRLDRGERLEKSNIVGKYKGYTIG